MGREQEDSCGNCKYWERGNANDEFDFTRSGLKWGRCDLASDNESCSGLKAVAICITEGIEGELMVRDVFLCSNFKDGKS